MGSKKVKRGIQSDHWHSQPASFAQTSRLAKETGRAINQDKLCTWEIGLTKKEASDLIGRCIAGDRAGVRAELIQRGAVLWQRQTTKRKSKAKAQTVAPPKKKPAKKSSKRKPPMKKCITCGKEVYAIHTIDGFCKSCHAESKSKKKRTSKKVSQSDLSTLREMLLANDVDLEAQIAAFKASKEEVA